MGGERSCQVGAQVLVQGCRRQRPAAGLEGIEVAEGGVEEGVPVGGGHEVGQLAAGLQVRAAAVGPGADDRRRPCPPCGRCDGGQAGRGVPGERGEQIGP